MDRNIPRRVPRKPFNLNRGQPLHGVAEKEEGELRASIMILSQQ
jgi:hypothetical protein